MHSEVSGREYPAPAGWIVGTECCSYGCDRNACVSVAIFGVHKPRAVAGVYRDETPVVAQREDDPDGRSERSHAAVRIRIPQLGIGIDGRASHDVRTAGTEREAP